MHLDPDAIPSNEQIRETLADRVYHPYKRVIWTLGTILVLLVVGYLLKRDAAQRHIEEQWTRYSEAATAGEENLQPGPAPPAVLSERVAKLDAVIRDYPNDSVTPWAMHAKLKLQMELEDHTAALATLSQLKSEFRDFAFCRLPLPDVTGQNATLADHVEAVIQQESGWAAKTVYVHQEPQTDRLALVETTAGKFWMAFYSDSAPKHVAAFVERAKRGDYNGRQVYEIRRASDGSAQVFVAGSIASGTESDPADHDRDEPTDTLSPEEARYTLRHVQHIVSSAAMPSGESASAFMVVAAPNGMRRLDGESTPFAAVIDREGSFDTVQQIAGASTYATHPKTMSSDQVFRVYSHPYPYIVIYRVTIWSEEKLEDGHTWDTALADTGEPQPGLVEVAAWLPTDESEDGGTDEGGEKDGKEPGDAGQPGGDDSADDGADSGGDDGTDDGTDDTGSAGDDSNDDE